MTDGFLHRHAANITSMLRAAREGGFTALHPETGTVSQGETLEESLANLREAVSLYFEEFSPGLVGQATPERVTPHRSS